MGNLSNWEKSSTLEKLFIHRMSQNSICFTYCNKLIQSLQKSLIRPDLQLKDFAILDRLAKRITKKITTLLSTFMQQCAP